MKNQVKNELYVIELLNGKKAILLWFFGFISVLNIIIPTIFSPILFYDSQKYINVANYFLSEGFNPNMCPIEVSPGYPLVLSIIISNFGESVALGPILGFLQGILLVSSYAFAAGITFELTRSIGLALIAALIASLSIGMAFNAATIFTETGFTFLVTGGLWLIVRALLRDNVPLYAIGLAVFLLSGWFRSTIHPLIIFLPILFLIQRFINQYKLHKHIKLRYIVTQVASVAIISSVMSSLLLQPIKSNDLGAREKLCAFWYTSITSSSFGKEVFKEQYSDEYTNIMTWMKGGARKPDLSGTRESLSPFAATPQDNWTRKYNSPNRLFWWRTPWYYRMAVHNDSELQAYRWAGNIGTDIFRKNMYSILKEKVTINMKSSISKPLRAVKQSSKQYSSQHIIYSDPLEQFAKYCSSFLNLMASKNIILSYHILIIFGLLLGLFQFRTISYFLICFMLCMIFSVNLILGGPYPRMFVHFIPFSGFSLIIISLFLRKLYKFMIP